MSQSEAYTPSESESAWQDESEETGDDDMDFELASDDITSSMDEDYVEEEEDGQNETTIYFDAEDGVLRTEDGEEIEIEDGTEEGEGGAEDGNADEQDGEEGSRTPQAAAESGQQTLRLTQEQLLQLLNMAGFRRILGNTGPTTRSQARAAQNGDDDDDDENFGTSFYGHRFERRQRRHFTGDRYPPIPSKEGEQLMRSGTFGNNDHCIHTACGSPFPESVLKKRKRLARRVLDRELGLESRGRLRTLNGLASQNLIPGSRADLIINFNARCYSGQFSEDGSFFFACGQDFRVRMYDTSNPYDWKYYKTVVYPAGQWTITDASLSPDNKLLAYSSIRSQVCLANTEQDDRSDAQYLDFSDMGSSARGAAWQRHRAGHFGIWSLRFSGDGGEIVAGTSDSSVYVYDLESRRSILRIPGHTDDVNAVCFGDKMSPHILFSGSDDTTLKVWDRRSLASMRPAGMFLGHTEGLTYIDSKGDGRYVISNAKDQTCKLWDLRKMISTDVGEKLNPQDFTSNFDYRFSPYNTAEHEPHPHDCSLVTFRGHRVLKTLIRCHFSPPGSTDGRYIYSGSHDGKIFIWNMDGTNASEPIDVKSSTLNSRPRSDERYVNAHDYYGGSNTWRTIVRDCSWHPSAPVIAATSWNGWDHGLGTCTVHSWNDGVDKDEQGDVADAENADGEVFQNASSLGSAPMGARVTAELHHNLHFYPGHKEQRRRTGFRVPGLARMMDTEDDEDVDLI